jgi:catechol 2,3-dioxygenase-like lactoylglutathione lyase family enzyme
VSTFRRHRLLRSRHRGLTRRELIAGFATAASLSIARLGALAQDKPSVLPLNTPKVDHLDVIVPNVEASARFYMGVFNTRLHAQPFQGGFRYFILFGDLPADTRRVGYLAIGDARGRATSIGHFCTSVFNYQRDSMAIFAAIDEAVAKAGLTKITRGSGVGGIFSDPDGIEVQFLPAPDTLVTAAVPSELVEPNKGLVTPRGVDHVLLHVADLQKGVQFYRILYGMEATREKSPERVWFRIGDTRLGLEQAQPGQKPHIDHFGVKVAPFDRNAVTAALAKLGATIAAAPNEPGVLRFHDLDGISVELVSA